jgi:hypothetical protein
MSRETRRRTGAALALVALMSIAGCSTLPTSPRPEVTPHDRSAAPAASAPAVELAEPTGLLPDPTAAISVTRVIIGSIGGRITAGNFTVVIPPLAVLGTVSVKVTQPDASKPYVDLSILPDAANSFRIPVTLVANASPMTRDNLAKAYISWFNPATGRWEPKPSKVDLERRTVSCPLQHFSTYRVESGSKAGW